jgi:hypothetical protein
VKLTDDRLAQFARVLRKSSSPQPGDNLLTIPGVLALIAELSTPITAASVSLTMGTAADPKAESFIINDLVDKSGAQALDSHSLLFASAGLWHIHAHLSHVFSGTANLGASDLISMTTTGDVLNAPFGPVNLSLYRRSVAQHEWVRDFWLPMLDAWTLTSITAATVAGDELHRSLTIIARRFF